MKNFRKNFFAFVVLVLFFAIASVQAQSVGINTLSPDPSAALDIQSTTGGLLIPRMTSAQIAALSSPADGLLVFNTDSGNTEMFVGGTAYELYNKAVSNIVTILNEITPAVWLNVGTIAPTELLGLNMHRFRMDLSSATEVRVIANVTGITLGLGGDLTISLQYSSDNGATWNYVNSATFGPGLSATVTGLLTTSWTTIDPAAQQDVMLRIVGQASGGIVTEVGLGSVFVEIR